MAIEITVRQEGAKPPSVKLTIENDGVRLLDLQRALCLAFKKPFPETMASVSVFYFVLYFVLYCANSVLYCNCVVSETVLNSYCIVSGQPYCQWRPV